MRALLSVYDKTGLVDLARGLVDLGWDLVASGSTAAALREAGLPVRRGGRGDRRPGDAGRPGQDAAPGRARRDPGRPRQPRPTWPTSSSGASSPSTSWCRNLYPFYAEPSVETIDIGGVTLLRAAAKNWDHVGRGRRPGRLRRRAGRAAGRRARCRTPPGGAWPGPRSPHTAAYDAAIVGWLDETDPEPATLPPTVHLALEQAAELRYGENPHQAGARYRRIGPARAAGTASSSTRACRCRTSTCTTPTPPGRWSTTSATGPAVAIVKHACPCGVGVADDLATAYSLAFEGDELSAFGGIVALNRPVDDATVERMVAAAQADVVIAPGYGDGRGRPAPGPAEEHPGPRGRARPPRTALALRQVSGGFLVQEPPRFAAGRDAWRVVTKAVPTEEQWADAELAWRVCAPHPVQRRRAREGRPGRGHRGRPAEPGGGGRDRRGQGRRAGPRAGACATDGFYPFPDGVEAAAAAGVAVVVQPGGSVKRRRRRRRRRRARPGHGPHRRAPVPPLARSLRAPGRPTVRGGAAPLRQGAAPPSSRCSLRARWWRSSTRRRPARSSAPSARSTEASWRALRIPKPVRARAAAAAPVSRSPSGRARRGGAGRPTGPDGRPERGERAEARRPRPIGVERAVDAQTRDGSGPAGVGVGVGGPGRAVTQAADDDGPDPDGAVVTRGRRG